MPSSRNPIMEDEPEEYEHIKVKPRNSQQSHVKVGAQSKIGFSGISISGSNDVSMSPVDANNANEDSEYQSLLEFDVNRRIFPRPKRAPAAPSPQPVQKPSTRLARSSDISQSSQLTPQQQYQRDVARQRMLEQQREAEMESKKAKEISEQNYKVKMVHSLDNKHLQSAQQSSFFQPRTQQPQQPPPPRAQQSPPPRAQQPPPPPRAQQSPPPRAQQSPPPRAQQPPPPRAQQPPPPRAQQPPPPRAQQPPPPPRAQQPPQAQQPQQPPPPRARQPPPPSRVQQPSPRAQQPPLRGQHPPQQSGHQVQLGQQPIQRVLESHRPPQLSQPPVPHYSPQQHMPLSIKKASTASESEQHLQQFQRDSSQRDSSQRQSPLPPSQSSLVRNTDHSKSLTGAAILPPFRLNSQRPNCHFNVGGMVTWIPQRFTGGPTRDTADPLFSSQTPKRDRKAFLQHRTSFSIKPEMLLFIQPHGTQGSCGAEPMKYVHERSTDADDGKAFERAGILPNVKRTDMPIGRTTHRDDHIIIRGNVLPLRPKKVWTSDAWHSISCLESGKNNTLVRIADHKSQSDIEFGLVFLKIEPSLSRSLHTTDGTIQSVVLRRCVMTVISRPVITPVTTATDYKGLVDWKLTSRKDTRAVGRTYFGNKYPAPGYKNFYVLFYGSGRLDSVKFVRIRGIMQEVAMFRAKRTTQVVFR